MCYNIRIHIRKSTAERGWQHMAETRQDFKTPSRKQPFFKIIKGILRLFYKRPRIEYLGGEEMPENCIIISNHCSMRGPMVMELYLPVFNIKWGAHEMLGNYKSRMRYLRDVYFRQKRGYNIVIATLLAGFEAFFSKWLYKGMKIIGTYPDARLVKTLGNSLTVLGDGASVLIFPENSNEGYKDELSEFFPGFVMLAEQYYRRNKKDIPICPIYYNAKRAVICVDKTYTIREFAEQGMKRGEIAEQFRLIVNNLYRKSLEV